MALRRKTPLRPGKAPLPRLKEGTVERKGEGVKAQQKGSEGRKSFRDPSIKCSKCAWRSLRRRKWKLQGKRCHPEWGCGKERQLQALDLAHLENLGMGGDRYDPEDPRNAPEKLVLLCRACHEIQEWIVRQRHHLWKNGFMDWVEPFEWNAFDFRAAVTGGLNKEQNYYDEKRSAGSDGESASSGQGSDPQASGSGPADG